MTIDQFIGYFPNAHFLFNFFDSDKMYYLGRYGEDGETKYWAGNYKNGCPMLVEINKLESFTLDIII